MRGWLQRGLRVLLAAMLVSACMVSAVPVQGAAVPAGIDTAFLARVGSLQSSQDVIVRLKGEPLVDRVPDAGSSGWLTTTAAQSAEKAIGREQDRFLAALSARKISYTVLQRLSVVYNGLALSVPGVDLAALAGTAAVSFVYESHTAVTLDTTGNTAMGVDQALWNRTTASGKKLDGTGMAIGIIDTGVDYTHPDLGGAKFPNAKVVGGYDFGDNDANPMDNNGHGTHVAGIAAADGKVQGVAPKAKLYAYKVFSDKGNGATDGAIIAALDRSVKDRCTVVNMSLGISGGTADTPENEAINNAVKAGVVVVAAVGNSGPRSPEASWPLGSPATALNAISVAASNDGPYPVVTVVAPTDAKTSPIMGSYADLAPEFAEGAAYDVVDAGYGSREDFAAVKVQGKVALVERGPLGTNGIYFRDKVLNAEAAGAAGVIIYNHSPGVLDMTLQVAVGDESKAYIPCIGITEDDGKELKALLAQGLRVRFSTQSHLGTMADFSSMGPTEDFHFKPEISAPGVAVNSTLPNGAYASLDGTSMASPAVAGAVALIKSAHPDWTAQTIKLALMNTADILRNWQNNEIITWTLQGSGRVNVPAAVDTPAVAGVTATDGTVTVQSGAVLVNDEAVQSPTMVKLRNVTASSVTFRPSFGWTLNGSTAGIQVQVSPSTVTLAPGATAQIAVKTSVDTAAVENGSHEGLITLQSSQGTLHVPYIYWHGAVNVPDQLSDVHVSSSTLSPLSGSAHVGFTIGYGGSRPAVDQSEEPQGSSFASQVTATVASTDGTVLGTIYSRSLLLVGSHSFDWDGRDVHGNFFLPNGNYLLRTSVIESNNDATNLKVTETAHQELPVYITGMEGTPSLTLAVSSGSLQQGKEVQVSLMVDSLSSLSKVTATLHYDPYYFAVRSVQAGNLMHPETSTFTSQTDAAAGDVVLNAAGTSGTGAGKGTVCTVTFTVLQPGSTEVWLEDPAVQTASGAASAIARALPLIVRAGGNAWDINGDKKVDVADMIILARAYGSTAGDARYNAAADLNGDGRVDETDLNLLRDHFGDVYP